MLRKRLILKMISGRGMDSTSKAILQGKPTSYIMALTYLSQEYGTRKGLRDSDTMNMPPTRGVSTMIGGRQNMPTGQRFNHFLVITECFMAKKVPEQPQILPMLTLISILAM